MQKSEGTEPKGVTISIFKLEKFTFFILNWDKVTFSILSWNKGHFLHILLGECENQKFYIYNITTFHFLGTPSSNAEDFCERVCEKR